MHGICNQFMAFSCRYNAHLNFPPEQEVSGIRHKVEEQVAQVSRSREPVCQLRSSAQTTVRTSHAPPRFSQAKAAIDAQVDAAIAAIDDLKVGMHVCG